MATPRRGTQHDDVVVPTIEQTLVSDVVDVVEAVTTVDSVDSHEFPAPGDDPVQVIMQAVDVIHEASLAIPSSEALADVLLKVQQVKGSLQALLDVEAERAADAIEQQGLKDQDEH